MKLGQGSSKQSSDTEEDEEEMEETEEFYDTIVSKIEIFSAVNFGKFHWKKIDIFNRLAQNIDCGYTLEPPRRGGGSNEYPQSMFWIKNKKNIYTPVNPVFTIKVSRVVLTVLRHRGRAGRDRRVL